MGTPGASRAQSTGSAEEHLTRGLEHYEAREFEQAIAEFHAGYKIEPRPAFLFALGQAERRSGDCASAMIYYQRFLATNPPDAQVQAARMHLERCRAALGSRPKARQSVTSAVAEAKDMDAPVPRGSPWYQDVAGDVLLGAGAASMVVGMGFVATSESAHDRAAWAATYPEYDVEIARAQRYRMWGVVALSAGTVLAAGALYRFYSRSDGADEQHLGIAPMSGGMALLYGGQF